MPPLSPGLHQLLRLLALLLLDLTAPRFRHLTPDPAQSRNAWAQYGVLVLSSGLVVGVLWWLG